LREQSVDMPHSSRNCCVMPVAVPSLCMVCKYQETYGYITE
jgi:hypothetical protein